MFWKKGNSRDMSPRATMVLLSFLSSGFISILASVAVVFLVYLFEIGNVDSRLNRMADDLQDEFCEYGGLTEKFIHCIEEDVEEHDPRVTFVMVMDPTNGVSYASSMPLGFQNRLIRRVSHGVHHGRFYTERSGVDHTSHGAVRFATRTLENGNHVVVARDVTVFERSLMFLAALLGVASLLITVFNGIVFYFAGGRILRLNSIIQEKDLAYRDLRRVTDDIAHDLRTPLTRLSAAAESEAAGEKLHDPLNQIVLSESRAMLELINTMLDISQTESRIFRTPREDVDLADSFRKAADLYSAVAEEKGIEFQVDIPSAALVYPCHKGKMQQLIGNLVENALKFTEKGGKVGISLRDDARRVTLVVADTGCGIAAADIPYIFRRFWRADSSRHLAGNGLGLALVRAIVNSYAGSIKCESEVGRGSTFTVSFPKP